ncbi:MAG: histidine kinase [Acidimicrobiales bacterium]
MLAHSVSVMVVQAAAADLSLPLDAGRAHEALGAVQDEGRQALTDLARLLGLLRHVSWPPTGRSVSAYGENLTAADTDPGEPD